MKTPEQLQRAGLPALNGHMLNAFKDTSDGIWTDEPQVQIIVEILQASRVAPQTMKEALVILADVNNAWLRGERAVRQVVIDRLMKNLQSM